MNYTALNWHKTALLIIDMQFDFTDPAGASPIDGTATILPALAQLAALFRNNGRAVVHVIRLYQPDGSNVDLCRRGIIESGKSIAAINSDGAAIMSSLLPLHTNQPDHGALLAGNIVQAGERDYIMYKSRWGAFYKTALEEFLQQLEVDSLVIAGCNFPNCPRTTIYEASERDFKTGIVPGTISGLYEKGITEMQHIGVNLVEWEEAELQLRLHPR